MTTIKFWILHVSIFVVIISIEDRQIAYTANSAGRLEKSTSIQLWLTRALTPKQSTEKVYKQKDQYTKYSPLAAGVTQLTH